MTAADTPLSFAIDNEQIVIRIGIGTNAWAFEHLDSNNPWVDKLRDFRQEYRVTNLLEFAKDVVHAMRDEREDGSTPFTDFLDKMCNAAIENGSIGIRECRGNKSAWVRDREKEME